MSLVVVRCPECFSPSRVDPDAVGQMVACPGCQAPFIAAEEIVPTVQPKPHSNATRASSSFTKPPAAPRRRPRPLPRPQEEAPPETHADRPHTPDPVHDPHHAPVAGLPLSVLVGLALLPFGIPLLWWAAPTVTGKAATLSIAVPMSLAIAASALCLGVVYTIDWTGTTRVKGVLMLVGLAYLSAAGLYFLKEDMMNRARALIGPPEIAWKPVISDDGHFKVMMPGRAENAKEQPIPKVEMQAGKRSMYQSATAGEFRYVALNGVPENPPVEPPEPAWFTEIGNHLAKSGKIINHSPVKNFHNRCAGYQWELRDGVGTTRIVQVYAHKGRVYYLSVEGKNLSTTDAQVARFFDSFEIVDAKR